MLRFIPPILPFVIFKNKNLLCDEYLQIPRKIKIRTIEISATTIFSPLILKISVATASRVAPIHPGARGRKGGGGDKGHKSDKANLRQKRSRDEKAARDERPFN